MDLVLARETKATKGSFEGSFKGFSTLVEGIIERPVDGLMGISCKG